MMNAIINKEIKISYHEGFRLLDKEEIYKMKYYDTPPDWVISDPERHIIISFSWKHANGFAAALAGTKDIAKNMKKALKAAMRDFDCEMGDLLRREMGGKRADGFKYHYTVQDTAMSGQSWSAKNKNNFYYIHCYYRTSLSQESEQIIDEIFDSISWN